MIGRDEPNPRLASIRCPVCERQLDAATDAHGTDTQPKHGDLSVCCYCRSFLRFVQPESGALRVDLLTLDEIADLEAGVRSMLVRARRVLKDMSA